MSEDFSDKELAFLSIMCMFKPAFRAEQIIEAGLGNYHPSSLIIKSLSSKGLIKTTAANAIVLNKDLAKKVLRENYVPLKYQKYLTNWAMQFKKKDHYCPFGNDDCNLEISACDECIDDYERCKKQ